MIDYLKHIEQNLSNILQDKQKTVPAFKFNHHCGYNVRRQTNLTDAGGWSVQEGGLAPDWLDDGNAPR